MSEFKKRVALEIDKKIPLKGRYKRIPMETSEKPVKKVARRSTKYPFAQMKMKDSFVVNTKEELKSALTSAIYYAKSRNINSIFTSRKQKDDTYRIWRIK